jgi:aspartokinase
LIDAILLRNKYDVQVILYKQHPVKSADPNIVKGQRLQDVTHMTFNEASKASVMGMKIVQNAAVRLAQEHNQTITVAPLYAPDQVTVIQQEAPGDTVVKCVTGIPNGAIVTLSNDKARILEDTLHHWEQYEEFRDLGTETLSTGEIIRDFLFYDATFLAERREQLLNMDPTIRVVDHVGIVTLIGDRMRTHPGVASAAISSIPHINIKRAVFLPHSSQIVLVIDEASVPEALRTIHAAVQQLNP